MKMYQAFTLDVTDLEEDELWRRLRKAGQEWPGFVRGLQARGYDVLHGMSEMDLVPVSVMIGADTEGQAWRHIKELFWEFTQQHQLPFKSGECYTSYSR